MVSTVYNNNVQKSLILENIDTFDQYKNMDVDTQQIFESRMMNACMTGQLQTVKEYLKSNNVNHFLYTGWTPLLYAALYAQAEIIEHLIKNGANVNVHKDGYTPLMALCNSNKETTEMRIKCLTLLIEAGANPNACNKQRQSALMHAVRSQEAEFVTELLKYVKNVNVCDNRKQTALMYATIVNKPHIVKILIENGADITLSDWNDLTVYDIASMKGYNNILTLFNIKEEKTDNACEIVKYSNWNDMFPSLSKINEQAIEFDIYTILNGMHLESYSHVFQGMDLKTFLKLTDIDLAKLGVDISAHRVQFMEHLHKFHRKRWSVQSIGAINKSLPYTLYNGIVSLGTVAKQVSIISCSFQYIKNCLLKTNHEKIYLNDEQIVNYEKQLKRTQETLNILEKELLQVEALSKVIRRKNDIGVPATYIGPKKHRISWIKLISITLILAFSVSKALCTQKSIYH